MSAPRRPCAATTPRVAPQRQSVATSRPLPADGPAHRMSQTGAKAHTSCALPGAQQPRSGDEMAAVWRISATRKPEALITGTKP